MTIDKQFNKPMLLSFLNMCWKLNYNWEFDNIFLILISLSNSIVIFPVLVTLYLDIVNLPIKHTLFTNWFLIPVAGNIYLPFAILINMDTVFSKVVTNSIYSMVNKRYIIIIEDYDIIGSLHYACDVGVLGQPQGSAKKQNAPADSQHIGFDNFRK